MSSIFSKVKNAVFSKKAPEKKVKNASDITSDRKSPYKDLAEKSQAMANANDQKFCRSMAKEFVWGKNCHLPGDIDYTFFLTKPFGLDSSMNFLDMNAGFGGLIRKVYDQYRVWTLGLASDEEVASQGLERSNLAGKGKKASVQFYDPETYLLKERTYDGILARDIFFQVEDKERLFKSISEGLKHWGQFAITDYIIVNPKQRNIIQEHWQQAEKKPAFFYSIEEYNKFLRRKDFSLELRVEEDISSYICDLTKERIKLAHKAITQQKPSEGLTREILNEVKIWAHRTSLIEQNIIKCYRFYLIRIAPEVANLHKKK